MMNKKIGLLYREKMVEEIKDQYLRSQACVFIGFSKLKALAFNNLRIELRKLDTPVFVSKNSLFKKALVALDRKDFDNFFVESTGLVFIPDEDITIVCKTLVNFAKANEGCLILKGGYLKEKKLEGTDIAKIADLPSRNILLGMIVSGFASPLTGFLSSLNQIILKFLWVIEEIRKKKG